ncbi:uncharacterized protein CMU_040320 [Cryptosporidium muris RN66]|uniref:Uncharacterized protein n=1 Tax=Cryptosporidium muris (strain RN66) TaxID=441375 RepID=B6A9S2_CRYMR|nr:uncharacterized protein CMU_040320 [Cryptosporidium muris RN66]EEA04963.1 hypothetical protein, conserved [Cryptosporidium muris RN66]|eukprot:XP_002139312.1 hypothetical protein [Cryptosporidium muris RN66]
MCNNISCILLKDKDYEEYIDDKELSKNFPGLLKTRYSRFGIKKGTVGNIMHKLPSRKDSIIITTNWEDNDYVIAVFIMFLLERLKLAHNIFNYRDFSDWVMGRVPPLDAFSEENKTVQELPEWGKWWNIESNITKVCSEFYHLYYTINSFGTFKLFYEKDYTFKKIKPYWSLLGVFSKERLKDNAFLNQLTHSELKTRILTELKLKKNTTLEYNMQIEKLSDNSQNNKIKNFNNENKYTKLFKTIRNTFKLFRSAYRHVKNIKKQRKFNSENGDSNIELLPDWWDNELDVITAIILTTFKYQYLNQMSIIDFKNKHKHEKPSLTWRQFNKMLCKTIFCIKSQKFINSIDSIPIWHRFGNKWQIFPQGVMVRILDSISRLSLNTSGWDIYDYIICACFYYILEREKLRIEWFALGPLSGSSSTRFWRKFKIFLRRIFGRNKGLFDISSGWFKDKEEDEEDSE